jgi:hypothetical protein
MILIILVSQPWDFEGRIVSNIYSEEWFKTYDQKIENFKS